MLSLCVCQPILHWQFQYITIYQYIEYQVLGNLKPEFMQISSLCQPKVHVNLYYIHIIEWTLLYEFVTYEVHVSLKFMSTYITYA